jgi:hypothetical protein
MVVNANFLWNATYDSDKQLKNYGTNMHVYGLAHLKKT